MRLEDAGHREDVADVVVDDQNLLAGQDRVGAVELLEHPPPLVGHLLDPAVEEH